MQINLTKEQMRNFAKEIQDTSTEDFLVARKAIKVNKEGQWSVMQYEGLKLSLTEALPGLFYENDIPYTFWSEVVRQVDRYIYYREQAEKARLQAIAEQQ